MFHLPKVHLEATWNHCSIFKGVPLYLGHYGKFLVNRHKVPSDYIRDDI